MLILIANASCDSQSYTNKKERKFTKDVLISSSAGGTSLTASLDLDICEQPHFQDLYNDHALNYTRYNCLHNNFFSKIFLTVYLFRNNYFPPLS